MTDPRIDVIQDPEGTGVIVSFGGIPVHIEFDPKLLEETDE